MVLVPRQNKKKILEYLFKEGVLTVKKDGMKAKHDDIDVPNLHVMMVMKSLHSKDLVVRNFNWQWFYYFLNDDGIEKLRELLVLPAHVFPATLTKQTRPHRSGVANPAESSGGKKGKGKGKGKGKKGGGWGGKGRGEEGGEEQKEYTEAAAPAAE